MTTTPTLTASLASRDPAAVANWITQTWVSIGETPVARRHERDAALSEFHGSGPDVRSLLCGTLQTALLTAVAQVWDQGLMARLLQHTDASQVLWPRRTGGWGLAALDDREGRTDVQSLPPLARSPADAGDDATGRRRQPLVVCARVNRPQAAKHFSWSRAGLSVVIPTDNLEVGVAALLEEEAAVCDPRSGQQPRPSRDRQHDRDVALGLVCKAGRLDLARSLVETLGASVGSAGPGVAALALGGGAILRAPATPLHLACLGGHEAVVAFLLGHDADVRAVDEVEQTPLHYASKGGHLRVVGQLLAAVPGLALSLDATAVGNGTSTPLRLAAERGHVDVSRALLRAGASALIPGPGGQFGWLPLDGAALYGNLDVLGLIETELSDPRTRRYVASSALFAACMWGEVRCAQFLVSSCGASVGRSGLQVSLDSLPGDGSARTFAALAPSRTRLGPLHLAASRGHTEMVEYLVNDAGGDLGERDANGWLPIHHAAAGGHASLLDALLPPRTAAVSASPRSPSTSPLSTLDLHSSRSTSSAGPGVSASATSRRRRSLPLVPAGEPVTEESESSSFLGGRVESGLTLLHLAAGATAASASASVFSSLTSQLRLRLPRAAECVGLLLERYGEVDLGARTSLGRTPLYRACHGKGGSVSTCAALVEAGALQRGEAPFTAAGDVPQLSDSLCAEYLLFHSGPLGSAASDRLLAGLDRETAARFRAAYRDKRETFSTLISMRYPRFREVLELDLTVGPPGSPSVSSGSHRLSVTSGRLGLSFFFRLPLDVLSVVFSFCSSWTVTRRDVTRIVDEWYDQLPAAERSGRLGLWREHGVVVRTPSSCPSPPSPFVEASPDLGPSLSLSLSLSLRGGNREHHEPSKRPRVGEDRELSSRDEANDTGSDTDDSGSWSDDSNPPVAVPPPLSKPSIRVDSRGAVSGGACTDRSESLSWKRGQQQRRADRAEEEQRVAPVRPEEHEQRDAKRQRLGVVQEPSHRDEPIGAAAATAHIASAAKGVEPEELEQQRDHRQGHEAQRPDQSDDSDLDGSEGCLDHLEELGDDHNPPAVPPPPRALQ